MNDAAKRADAGEKSKPLLFLSHAGDDYEAAAELKRRIEESEEARRAGLSVWFDKTHIGAGFWQPQLEAAIAKSTAFAVYIGRHGIVNWVEAEVRAALNRAIRDKTYPFIPIFASKNFDPDTLPMFAQGFQVMANPQEPEDFKTLIAWILKREEREVQLERDPFFGLDAINERRGLLFFGRDKETADLVDKLRNHPLVLVSGDSGSGKSSLVRAGVVRRFLGRELLSPQEDPQRDIIYHAVVTQPGADPWRLLGEAVEQIAKQMDCSPADQELYASFARNQDDFCQVRRGLRCHLNPKLVRILLVVDQFEELFKMTPASKRDSFVRFLLSLVTPADPSFRVVLTMREDYVNLLATIPELATLLDADDGGARYILGGMDEDHLKQIVCRPLSLAGVDDETERETLASALLRGMGHRPGDLALVQMALSETWRLRDEYHGNLLQAYTESVRIEIALAGAGESFREKLGSDLRRSQLDDILIRLIRIGEAGGATRRTATRDEFDDEKWSILQDLATAECKRIVLISGSQEMPTAELWHESLAAAWPHLHDLLYGSGSAKLALDDLIPSAKTWIANKRSAGDLATGALVQRLESLAANHRSWLSKHEIEFIEASVRLARLKKRAGLATIAGSILLAAALFWQGYQLNKSGKILLSQALADRALAVAQSDPEEGLLYANEAFENSRSTQAEQALRRLLSDSLVRMRMDHDDPVHTIAFNGDGGRLITTSGGKAYIWDNQTGTVLGKPLKHDGGEVLSAAFSPTSDLAITGSTDGRARLWRSRDTNPLNWEPVKEFVHGKGVLSVALSKNDRMVATGGTDGVVLIWEVDPGEIDASAVLETVGANKAVYTIPHDSVGADGKPVQWAVTSVEFVEFAAGEEKLVTASGTFGWLWDLPPQTPVRFPHLDEVIGASLRVNGSERLMTAGGNRLSLWDPSRVGVPSALPMVSNFPTDERIFSAAFSASGSILLAALSNGTVQVRQAISGVVFRQLLGHHDNINSVALSPDGVLAATASNDHTARLWSTTPEDLAPLITTVIAENVLGKATFSPRNSAGEIRLAIATDWDATIWDAVSGHRVVIPATVDRNNEAASETITFDAFGDIADVQFDSTGDRVTTASPNGAGIWSVIDRRQLMQLWREEGALGVHFNRAGDRLLTWGPRTVAFWDVSSSALPASGDPLEPKPLREVKFDADVIAAAFVAEGDKIAVVTKSGLTLWDPVQNRKRRKTQSASEASFGCTGNGGDPQCTPTVIAIAGDDKVIVRTLADDDWPVVLEHPATHAVLSADGKLVAAITSNRAEIFAVKTGEIVEVMHTTKNRRDMLVAAFSPDGRLFVTGRERGWIDIWAMETGERETRFQDDTDDITSVSFSPETLFLMTATAKTARIHRRERFETIDRLREWIPQRTTEMGRRVYRENREKAQEDL